MALSEPSIDKENEKQTSDKLGLDDVDESNVQVISEAAGENGFISGSENGSKCIPIPKKIEHFSGKVKMWKLQPRAGESSKIKVSGSRKALQNRYKNTPKKHTTLACMPF